MKRLFLLRAASSIAALSAIFAVYLGCSSSDSPQGIAGDPVVDASTDSADSADSTGKSDTATADSSPDVTDSSATDGDAGDESPDVSDASDSSADTIVDSAVLPEADVDAALPPACAESSSWQSPSLLAISGSDDDRFGSISADELTIAWTSGKGASAVVHYADRSSVSSAFGAAKSVDASVGPFAIDRAALSADGLRIVMVKANRKGFVELVRASRQDSFGTNSSTAFDMMNEAGNQFPTDQYFADPVLSLNDRALYYSVYGAGLTATLRMSFRVFSTEGWFLSTKPFSFSAFDAQGSQYRHPTGISSDERSLFFWDEVDSKQKTAIRPSFEDAFTKVVDLGNRQFASPNQGCNRIYYTAQGASSLDLFVSQAN